MPVDEGLRLQTNRPVGEAVGGITWTDDVGRADDAVAGPGGDSGGDAEVALELGGGERAPPGAAPEAGDGVAQTYGVGRAGTQATIVATWAGSAKACVVASSIAFS